MDNNRQIYDHNIVYLSLPEGTVLKNFITAVSAQNHTNLKFTKDGMYAVNNTEDDKAMVESVMHGDQADLQWHQHIPVDKQNISISFDFLLMKMYINKIHKKDSAQIALRGKSYKEHIKDISSFHSVSIIIIKGSQQYETMDEVPATISSENFAHTKINFQTAHKLPIQIKAYTVVFKHYIKFKSMIQLTLFVAKNPTVQSGILLQSGNSLNKVGNIPVNDDPEELKNYHIKTYEFDPARISLLVNVGISKVGSAIFHFNDDCSQLCISHVFGPWGEHKVYLN